MKSSTAILIGCWILMILHWTTNMFPDGIVPGAFCVSYMIMWLVGAFKNEDQFHTALIDKGNEIHDGLSDRQKDFIEKMQQGKEEGYQPDEDALTTINMMDEDGNRSSVTIMEDGTVETTGNPNPDIVEAAKMIRRSVLDHGPEAVAQELSKQIDKINRGES